MRTRKARTARPNPKADDTSFGVVAAAVAIGAVLVGTAVLVDSSAEAAFAAPKRLVAMFGIAGAFVALMLSGGEHFLPRSHWSANQRRAVLLVVAGGVLTLLSAAFSPRRALALDSARVVFVFAMLLPISASRLFEGLRVKWLLAAFFGACAVNSVLSILQAGGLYQPLEVAAITGRTNTGALLGNEGHLAMLLSLAALGSSALVLVGVAGRFRAIVLGCTALFAAALVVNLNFTALFALLAGEVVLFGAVYRRAAFHPSIGLVVVLIAVVALYPPFRGRIQEMAHQASEGRWNDVLTNRLGPWAAAVEMGVSRPILGWGPGTFEAEYVPHRLQAELWFRDRLLIPRVTSNFAQAHSDYLQAFAEVGLPATLALLAAAGLVLRGLIQRVREPESVLLLSMLVAGGVAATTWFPLQQPTIAAVLLLCAGRAWRRLP